MGNIDFYNDFDSLTDDFMIKKDENEIVVALAGNPNVGKSTIFNALTGLNQHTGNWSGKTVENALGRFKTKNNNYVLVDIPGTYSLLSHSKEEKIASDFLCFGKPDITVVVCDATCLERNLNLAIQILEITKNVIICVNFLDEAKKKGIYIDLQKIENRLGVKVVGVTAKNKITLKFLKDAIDGFIPKDFDNEVVVYPGVLKSAILPIEERLKVILPLCDHYRWLSIRFLENDKDLYLKIKRYYGFNPKEDTDLLNAINFSNILLNSHTDRVGELPEIITSSIYEAAENVLKDAVFVSKSFYSKCDRKLDKIFTGKITGFPIMLLFLALIFWITLVGANSISDLLSTMFLKIENILRSILTVCKTPSVIISIMCDGVWNVLSWVVSVMLPPMMIFFPLFAVLEASGYLPRIAYNLDKPFKKCSSCGKQALTMCMGFGCNAAGVMGTRIITSKRERLLAILTNNFVPCNGRFPMMILVISLFIVGNGKSVYSALVLSSFIVFGILITMFITKILSKTILKGASSSFILELPSYKKPQIIKTVCDSLTEKAASALLRAIVVAAPAGFIIWLATNITIKGTSIMLHCSNFLEPIGSIMGLDGIVLMAFIFGIPANEIVIPIAIMAYSSGKIIVGTDVQMMGNILLANGWDIKKAICFLIFALFHWPCSTSLITIKKETNSYKWMLLAFLIPTLIGTGLCIITNAIINLI